MHTESVGLSFSSPYLRLFKCLESEQPGKVNRGEEFFRGKAVRYFFRGKSVRPFCRGQSELGKLYAALKAVNRLHRDSCGYLKSSECILLGQESGKKIQSFR